MKSTVLVVGDRKVGEGEPCFVIAEMGLGHDGSLGAAHAFIDAVADAGADAVKFQTHIASAEGTREEEFRVNIFSQDENRQDYWKRTSFSKGQWKSLKRHADEKNIAFLSSPFSLEAVHLLLEVGVPAWKIGSGEANNTPLLQKIAETGIPVLLSTGMSSLEEVTAAVAVFQKAGSPLLLFQCTSRYPCPPEHFGLNMIGEYRKRFRLPVGYSDHSGSKAPGVAALVLGACAVEVHVTFSRKCFGPDVQASVTVEELRDMVQSFRLLERALASPVDKEEEVRELGDIRSLFTKSIVASRSLETGKVLERSDLDFKKPGTGIPSAEADSVAGRRLTRSLRKDDQFTWEDLDER